MEAVRAARHRYHEFRWHGPTIIESGAEAWPRTQARCTRCGEERVISLFVDGDALAGPCVPHAESVDTSTLDPFGGVQERANAGATERGSGV